MVRAVLCPVGPVLGLDSLSTLMMGTCFRATGGMDPNHNETLAVRSNVKAGLITGNHNESFRR